MPDNKIELTVQINSQTGELEVVGNKLNQAKGAADDLGQSFLGLSNVGADLLKVFGGYLTIDAVVGFFKNAVSEAESFNESVRRLTITYGDNSRAAIDWGEQIQKNTRFSDNQAFSSLERLSRVTKDFAQAQSAAALAMDISSATGRNLQQVTEVLFDLINGNSRAIRQARNEFGDLIKVTDGNQLAVEKLIEKFKGAAEKEQSLTKESALLRHEFEDLEKSLGKALIPGLTAVVEKVNSMIHGFSHLKNAIQSMDKDLFTKYPSDMRVKDEVKNEEKKEEEKTKAVEKGAKERMQIEVQLDQEAFEKRIDGIMETNKIVREIYADQAKFEMEINQDIAKDRAKTLNFTRDLSKDVTETMTKDFSKAFADAIMYGKNFEETYVSIFQNITSQIIQAITQMLIFRTLAAATGSPMGGFMPWGAAGSPSSPKGPRAAGSSHSVFTQNPSAMRSMAAALRTVELYNAKPYGY